MEVWVGKKTAKRKKAVGQQLKKVDCGTMLVEARSGAE
jgi:hypothetical protein